MKNMVRYSRALAAALFLSAAIAAGAQDTGTGQDLEMDLDALFGEEVVESADSVPVAGDPVSAALKTESVRIGGSFSAALTPSATWDDPWGGAFDPFNPDHTALSASLKSTLFFDARPAEDFRVYGSAKTGWPFSTETSDSIAVPNIAVFELFSDISLDDRAFLRFGKSTVKWGVGYFWSPADVINLEQINILDAGAQREGPIHIRLNIPVQGTQNNLYLYTILDESDVDFETTALAGKAEFLLGKYEFGLGGYYRQDTAERAMFTLTGPLGDFDVFGEAMVSRGSAKTFITDISTAGLISSSGVEDNREDFYFSASTGFMYSSQKDNFSVIGQYFYNGEGYSPTDRDALVADAKLAMADPANFAQWPQLASSLVNLAYGSGRHYAAVSLSASELFADELSASLIVVANLSDGSGLVKPTATWKVADNFSLSLSPLFIFGPADGEYAFLAGGNPVTLSLGATLSGSF